MASSVRASQREPQRQNGRRTKEQLLVAAAEILVESGLEGFSMTAVAKRAHVAPGSVYWFFADKNALLAAVHARAAGEFESAILGLRDTPGWEEASLRQAVEAVVLRLAEIYGENPQLLRVFMMRAKTDAGTMERTSSVIDTRRSQTVEVLAPHLQSAGHPEPRQAAEELFVMAAAVIGSMLEWPDFFERKPTTLQRIIDRLVNMAVAEFQARIAAAATTN